MKKRITKVIAVLLSLAMLICIGTMGATAQQEIHTDCNGKCEHNPCIIVPGLGQSNTWVLDENGDYVLDDEGNKITSFPAYIQLPEVIKTVILPAVFSLILQTDVGFSDAAAEAIGLCFEINACDNTGHLINNVETEKYLHPVSEYEDFEMEEVQSHVPFALYEHDQPLDHFYYFTYNSFDNHIDLTAELYEYIQMVKQQTGHDKVTLIPLSQGGSITSAMLEYYPNVKNDLHKIIFVVPALDGSTIIGDVLNDRVNFLNADYLYHGFLAESGLMDKETAAMIEVLLRILPDDVLVKALEKAVDKLVTSVISKSTAMWALCPSGDYPTAAEKYLSAPELADLKAQTDRYYKAQLNCHDNILELIDNGVQVFCLAEYDTNMINVGETWNTQNADYIIQLDSTSMGAHAAKVGETLPEDYVQQNTNCQNPDHNHISPDRVVDASTGLLPDHTFYFDGQKHERTANNDIILKLALKLIEGDDIKSVYSDPAFPQFNIGREPINLRYLLATAKDIDTTSLSKEDAAELAAAIEEAEKVMANTVGVVGEVEKSEARLTAILVKIGVMQAPEVKESNDFFIKVSDWLYENFGSNGFSEMPIIAIKKVFDK